MVYRTDPRGNCSIDARDDEWSSNDEQNESSELHDYSILRDYRTWYLHLLAIVPHSGQAGCLGRNWDERK
jgi:hypothetical protein